MLGLVIDEGHLNLRGITDKVDTVNSTMYDVEDSWRETSLQGCHIESQYCESERYVSYDSYVGYCHRAIIIGLLSSMHGHGSEILSRELILLSSRFKIQDSRFKIQGSSYCSLQWF